MFFLFRTSRAALAAAFVRSKSCPPSAQLAMSLISVGIKRQIHVTLLRVRREEFSKTFKNHFLGEKHMSTLRNTLVFFDQLGVYDVVLPFLLVFSLVFAMLEKTRVFGEEGGQTRKNLNSMVAFCSAFLVVASSQLVAVINETIARTMVLMIMAILFMILLGTFSEDKPLSLKGGWHSSFMWIMFVGIALILLNSLGWLQFAWEYAAYNLNGPIVGSFILLVIVLGFMVWLTSGNKAGGGGHDHKAEGGGH